MMLRFYSPLSVVLVNRSKIGIINDISKLFRSYFKFIFVGESPQNLLKSNGLKSIRRYCHTDIKNPRTVIRGEKKRVNEKTDYLNIGQPKQLSPLNKEQPQKSESLHSLTSSSTNRYLSSSGTRPRDEPLSHFV